MVCDCSFINKCSITYFLLCHLIVLQLIIPQAPFTPGRILTRKEPDKIGRMLLHQLEPITAIYSERFRYPSSKGDVCDPKS